MKKIAIFASGTGSNAARISKYFEQSQTVQVALILSNNPTAPVLEKARECNIPTQVFDREVFYETDIVARELEELGVDLIVLAGFLWLVPPHFVRAFPNKIVNIHPALLPKFGGKGMYGMNVHKAVIENKDKESGITIHFVNENYDEGAIVFQAKCEVDESDSPESLAHKIHLLEHEHYAKVIETILLDR